VKDIKLKTSDESLAIIGYVRSSSTGDDVSSQIAALANSHCEQIFKDEGPGTRIDRPNLELALTRLQEGDVLVVASLNCIARSLSHAVSLVSELRRRGVELVSVADSIDTAASADVARLFEAFARFERDIACERTATGRQTASLRGRRPVITPAKLKLAKSFIADGVTVREAAARIEVSKTVLYDALRADMQASNARRQLIDTE
jgi:DNA invertase Pin-like site-specific DNA recombinase